MKQVFKPKKVIADKNLQSVIDVLNKTIFISRVNCRVYGSADQDDINDNSWTTLKFDVKDYDLGENYSVRTHSFTTPVPGYYEGILQVWLHDLLGDKRYGAGFLNVTSNEWLAIVFHSIGVAPSAISIQASFQCYIPRGNDIVFKVYQQSGGSLVDVSHGQWASWGTIKLFGI
ncbi:MAG: hypothetical protein ACFFCW_20770 [Candidatus Hodarchaeota archaeon]